MHKGNLFTPKQRITVKEARKLLGKPGRSMTDDQIKEVIEQLTLIAKHSLRYNSSKKA